MFGVCLHGFREFLETFNDGLGIYSSQLRVNVTDRLTRVAMNVNIIVISDNDRIEPINDNGSINKCIILLHFGIILSCKYISY